MLYLQLIQSMHDFQWQIQDFFKGGGCASIKQQYCNETGILEQLCTGCKEPLRLGIVNEDIQDGYITNS